MKCIGKILSLVLALAALLTATGAAAQGTLVVSNRFLDVLVDVDQCEFSTEMCFYSGSIGPAADGNDSVVAFHIHAKGPLGNPIAGLLEADFALSSVTNAAPGITPTFVDTATCGLCFYEPQPGVYRMAVRPLSGDWGSGSYVVLLEVTFPSGTVRQVAVPIDIPN